MIDDKILMSFFNFDAPCPSVIKNCIELRGLYTNQKELITSKKCTTCTVANFTEHFIKNVLYKNYFNVEKVNISKIKPYSTTSKTDTSDVFVPKQLYRRGHPINQATYFGKTYLYIHDRKNKYKVYAKIHFTMSFFSYRLYVLGRCQNSLKKFKILLINESTHNIIYASKEKKHDEV